MFDPSVYGQLDVGVDDVFGGLRVGAGDDGVPVESGALGRGPQQRVFRGWRQRLLRVEDPRRVLEEGIVRLLLRADAVSRSLEGGGMNIYQRKLLEDNARGRKVLDDLVHRRLRRLAVRALQVGELHQHKILAGTAACSSGGFFLEQIPSGGVRSCAEVDQACALNDVIAVRCNVEDRDLGLCVG